MGKSGRLKFLPTPIFEKKKRTRDTSVISNEMRPLASKYLELNEEGYFRQYSMRPVSICKLRYGTLLFSWCQFAISMVIFFIFILYILHIEN